jgi:hypothetical protein
MRARRSPPARTEFRHGAAMCPLALSVRSELTARLRIRVKAALSHAGIEQGRTAASLRGSERPVRAEPDARFWGLAAADQRPRPLSQRAPSGTHAHDFCNARTQRSGVIRAARQSGVWREHLCEPGVRPASCGGFSVAEHRLAARASATSRMMPSSGGGPRETMTPSPQQPSSSCGARPSAITNLLAASIPTVRCRRPFLPGSYPSWRSRSICFMSR